MRRRTPCLSARGSPGDSHPTRVSTHDVTPVPGHRRRPFRRGGRQFPQRGDPPPARRRVHRLPRLALPALRCADPAVGQHPGDRLARAWRTLPRLPRADRAALPARRTGERPALGGARAALRPGLSTLRLRRAVLGAAGHHADRRRPLDHPRCDHAPRHRCRAGGELLPAAAREPRRRIPPSPPGARPPAGVPRVARVLGLACGPAARRRPLLPRCLGEPRRHGGRRHQADRDDGGFSRDARPRRRGLHRTARGVGRRDRA